MPRRNRVALWVGAALQDNGRQEAGKNRAGRSGECTRPPFVLASEGISTTRPGTRKAHGPAGGSRPTSRWDHDWRGCSRPPLTSGAGRADSGAETAFLAMHGTARTRAAQRRPGAEAPELDLSLTQQALCVVGAARRPGNGQWADLGCMRRLRAGADGATSGG